MEYEVVKSLKVLDRDGAWRQLKEGDRISASINSWEDFFQEELDKYSGENNTKIVNWLVMDIDLPYDEVHIMVKQDGNDDWIELPEYCIDEIKIHNKKPTQKVREITANSIEAHEYNGFLNFDNKATHKTIWDY